MIRLLVITTKGCEACKLTINNINKYITANDIKDVQLETKDISEVDYNFRKEHNLEDFPTTFVIKDDNILINYVGYIPSISVKAMLNL